MRSSAPHDRPRPAARPRSASRRRRRPARATACRRRRTRRTCRRVRRTDRWPPAPESTARISRRVEPPQVEARRRRRAAGRVGDRQAVWRDRRRGRHLLARRQRDRQAQRRRRRGRLREPGRRGGERSRRRARRRDRHQRGRARRHDHQAVPAPTQDLILLVEHQPRVADVAQPLLRILHQAAREQRPQRGGVAAGSAARSGSREKIRPSVSGIDSPSKTRVPVSIS